MNKIKRTGSNAIPWWSPDVATYGLEKTPFFSTPLLIWKDQTLLKQGRRL